MRISCCLYTSVLLLASSSPLIAQTQFQPPNPAELKMTADPQAPGADAVYLDYEEIDNDPLHYQAIYARIKVLTEKGKELATVHLPYVTRSFKITAVEGRTIHPDGTIIPLTTKPEDLMASKSSGSQVNQKVFTLPSVDVGSVLEYRYQISYDDSEFSSPFWQIQRKYFVHKAHYEFTPFPQFMPHNQTVSNNYLVDSKGNVVNSLIWWSNLPPGVTIQTDIAGRYSVDLTDVPPIPDEDWMPPIESVLYRVFFYYESVRTPSEFWVQSAKEWSKDVDHFADPSKPIQEAVAGIVKPGDSDLVKAQKLYSAVEALDNTDYSRTMTASEMKELKIRQARRAQDTWKQKSGSSDDIALLYLAMLRAAGLKAYAAKVADRSQRIFDPSYMDFDQLSDTLAILELDGKRMYLDPGQKMCPFGTLAWNDSDAGGIRQSAQGVVFAVTPEQQYTGNVTQRIAYFTLDAQGGITGQIRYSMSGQAALEWRQAALEMSLDDLKKQFDRSLLSVMPQGVDAHITHFLGLDQPDSALIAIADVKGTLGAVASGHLLLPGFFFHTRGDLPFVKEAKRMEPVDMRYADSVIDDVTYELPKGYTVEGAPQDATNLWKGHAIYIAKTTATPGEVEIDRTFEVAFTFAKAAEYQELRGFYQKAAAADQQELVLSQTTAAKGN